MSSSVTIKSSDANKMFHNDAVIKSLAKVIDVPSTTQNDVQIPDVASKVDTIATAINDAHSVKQILPDVKLCQAILTSSIISPHDLNSGEMSYVLKGPFEDVPVAGEMLKVIKDHFDTVYRMQDELPRILDDALFDKGSHVKIILPESEIQRIIESHNAVSFESLKLHLNPDFTPKSGLGFIGHGIVDKKETSTDTLSFENFFGVNGGASNPPVESIFEKQLKITCTDNTAVLRIPELIKRLRKDKLNTSFENATIKAINKYKEELKKKKNKGKDGDVKGFRPQQVSYSMEPVVATTYTDVSGIEESDIGTVLDAPPEAVIPIFGQDPSKHIGYWFVLDAQGYFIKRSREVNYYNVMGSSLNGKQQASQMLNQTMTALYGVNATEGDASEQNRLAQFGEIVTKELLTRLQNGLYKEELSLSARQDLYKVMFARALEGKRTQLLYIPAEYVCYFAFDYNEQGIGESLLEQTKIISSMRSAILLADTFGHMRNAIGRTILDIQFDGSEPDPLKIKNFVVNDFIDSKSPMFPIGEPNPNNMMNFLRRAGVEVKMSGHPGLPETKVEIDNFNSGISLTDSDLEDTLKRRQYMGFGMAPETIDEAKDLSLATSVVKRDLLLTKQVIVYQNKLMPTTTKFVRTVAKQSGAVIYKLYEKIEKFKGDLPKALKPLKPEQLVSKFIDSIYTQLPKPDSTTLENLIEGLTQYSEAVEVGLEYRLNEDIFNADTLGELEVTIPVLKSQLHSMLMRRYMRSNNILPELDELFGLSSDENPALVELEAHVEAISEALADHMRKIKENLLKIELKGEKDQIELDAKREAAEEEMAPKEEDEEDDVSDEQQMEEEQEEDTATEGEDGEGEGADLIADDDTEGSDETPAEGEDGDGEGADLIADDDAEEEPEDKGSEEESSDDDGANLIEDDETEEEEPKGEEEEPKEEEVEEQDEDDENAPLI